MTLLRKTLIVIGLTLVGLLVGIFVASQATLLQGFAELERQDAQNDLERLTSAIDGELAKLTSTAQTYSHWDDTYAFIEDRNEQYINDNLFNELFPQLGFNLVVYANANAEIVFSKSVDFGTGSEVAVPADLASFFVPGSPLLNLPETNSLVTGIIMLTGRPMLVTSNPILTSLQEGPSRGAVVFGRYLDSQAIEALSEQIQLEVLLFNTDNQELKAEHPELSALTLDNPTAISTGSQNTIDGFKVFPDVNGNPAIIMEIESARNIFAQGQNSLQLFAVLLVIVGVVFTVVSVLLLRSFVLGPLSRLVQNIGSISASRNISERLKVEGKDELAKLGGSINTMLGALEDAEANVRESEARVKAQNELLTNTNHDLIIARRQAEEATRLKSQFLATMSHELRTPLNAIIGYTEIQLAGMTGELNNEQRDYQRRILTNAEHLLELINDVLDISKIEAGRLDVVEKTFVISDLLGEVVYQTSGLIGEKAIRLETQIDEQLPERTTGDYGRLKQILINLVSNAVKFTDKGFIRIEMTRADTHNWTIIVSDTGAGIPSHALEYIFEEFRQVDGSVQRKYGGSGLGLSIVRKLVLLMNGNIRVKSKVGEGSVFMITLPLKTETEAVPVI